MRARLSLCCLKILKRVIGKQFKPSSDTAKRGVWSESPLFVNSFAIFLYVYLNHIAQQT